ncbi:hypothetical protein [Enterococcus wangshanyuanii]|uniref:Uncharacterized protein n=1 Tax=Enterococcus wangshanyuanii TaxID=2005703 RepID=A0ABQ1PSZ2_9ENTE|nr:hypothetical protein [Enterococcus wangshanyuanii]GGD03187.1 hypothetical protein GCM10011573_35820 [Enterococcus wangshanyuanii]
MPTTNMTPEEVLKYGKRIVLFQKGKGRGKREFIIQDNRVFQQAIEYIEGCRHIIESNQVEIMDIYNEIERVYSQKNKGVLIARRAGNYKSNQKRLLPLRKTGKGMGEVIQGARLAKAVYQLMDEDNQPDVVKRRAQQRIEKAKKEEDEKERLRQEKKQLQQT